MKPDYKRVKVLRPHCPKCKEILSGNNSMALPYECSCGVWEIETCLDMFDIDYKIKPKEAQ